MDARPTFGDLLHRLVRSRGLTMDALARRLGLSPSTLSRLRTGRRAPRAFPWEAVREALGLGDEEFARLRDLALIEQAPAALRDRLAESETRVAGERERRQQVEHGFGVYRVSQQFYDGWWLAYNHTFIDDGRIQRTLVHIAGASVRWTNLQRGTVHYSYRGEMATLADKLFMRLDEERGGAEWVQVTLEAFFDFARPAFLYGLVAGISGTSIHHPHAYPAAARVLLLYAADEAWMAAHPEDLGGIEASLGAFDPAALGPFHPPGLPGGEWLRRCLGLGARDDLDAVCRRLIDNRLAPGQHVLRAVPAGG